MLYLVIADGYLTDVCADPQEAQRLAEAAAAESGEDASIAVYQIAAEQVHASAPEPPPAPPPPPPPPPKPPNQPPPAKPKPGMRRVPNQPKTP